MSLADLESTLLFHEFIFQADEAPEAYLYGNDGQPITDREMLLMSVRDRIALVKEVSSLDRSLGMFISFMLCCIVSLAFLFCMLIIRKVIVQEEKNNDAEEGTLKKSKLEF